MALIASGLWGTSWWMKSSLAGVKPTVSYDQYAGADAADTKASLAPDPALDVLRTAVKESPGDIDKLRTLANAIGERLAGTEKPPTTLVFELIDTLRAILDKKPDDPQALVSMANVAYNSQAFDKAAEYYAHYLKVAPDDYETRSTYASALALLGKYKEAEEQIKATLKQKPGLFSALANRAINEALAGHKEAALTAVKAASSQAPNKESADKLAGFIESINAEKAKPSDAPTALSKAAQVVKDNPVAGPKLIREERSGSELRLFLKDFPMAAMPPFAKEKFLNGTKEKILALPKNDQPEAVIFLDHDSGQVLERLEIKP